MADKKAIIKALPVGKKNAVKMKDLETTIGNPTKGTNNDVTRTDIKNLIMKDNIPIGTSPNGDYVGVWLIDSDAEYDEVIARIDRVIEDYKAKRKAITDGWNKRKASKKKGVSWPK